MHYPRTTALERLLVTERHRRRADESSGAGFAVPTIAERAVEGGVDPLVVSDARGRLVRTRVSKARGVARSGFFECSVAEEARLVGEFFEMLWEVSRAEGWGNRCSSLAEASKSMQLEPRSVVIPHSWLEKATGLCREEAEQLMAVQGYVAKDDQQILVADLADGDALLVAAPTLAGFYTRADTHLSVMLTRADQAFFLVRGTA